MTSLGAFFTNILFIINGILVPLIFALAFIVFLYGVFKYFIAGGGSDEKRKEGRTFILYGIIGFVVMLSVWGIVNLLLVTLGFGWQARPPIPYFGGSSGSPGGSFYGGGSYQYPYGSDPLFGSMFGGNAQPPKN